MHAQGYVRFNESFNTRVAFEFTWCHFELKKFFTRYFTLMAFKRFHVRTKKQALIDGKNKSCEYHAADY